MVQISRIPIYPVPCDPLSRNQPYLRNRSIVREESLISLERATRSKGTPDMESTPKPEQTSMPIFILFDTQTGYLYGHLFATGPEDPFLQEVIDWWGKHCSNSPIGLDHPELTQTVQPVGGLSSN